jgi:serine/threonine protein kinase
MRQSYNLFHILERNEDDEDTRREVEILRDEIIEHDLKSLHTKDDNPKGKKRKRSGAHDDAGAGGVGAEDQVVLRARGYEVKPEAIVDASGIVYEPLFKVWHFISYLCTALMLDPQKPSHILTVFRPSIPGKELIAKKVHEESNELEILQLLNTFQPNSEHVISLVDSFQTQSTFWVILPKMESVAAYVVVAPLQLSEKVAQICWGLIQGVAHLHKVCIAHRDIKPSNLVVDRDFCLKIIDFDLAMQVKDEDEEVNDQCGTKHWMAPEVEKKLAYSPVKADRWSSGRVLLYLLDELRKEDELLRTIGRKLTAHNPKHRPSMDEVAAPLSGVSNSWRHSAVVNISRKG